MDTMSPEQFLSDVGVADGAPPAPKVTPPVASSSGTPSNEDSDYEARIAKYAPQAQKAVAATPMYSQSPDLDIPILKPLAEKAGAAVNALIPFNQDTYGSNFSDRYQNTLAYDEAYKRAKEAQLNPVSKAVGTVGNIAGGIALTPELGVAKGLAPFVGSTLSKIGGTLGEGALYGGASAATDTPPDQSWSQTAQNAGTGALQGATVSGVLGGTMATAGQLAKIPINTLKGIVAPESTALKKLAGNAETSQTASGFSPDQFQDLTQAGTKPIGIPDIQGGKEAVQAAAAHVPNDPNIQKLNDILQNRLTNSAQRFQDAVDTTFGQKIDANALRANAKQAAANEVKPLYQTAFSNPRTQFLWNQDLQTLANTPMGAKAISDAMDTINTNSLKTPNGLPSGMYGQSTVKSSPFRTNSSGKVDINADTIGDPDYIQPNLEFWDQVKRNLNSKYGGQYDPNSLQNATTSLTGFLRGVGGPEYQQALDSFAKYKGEDNAFDLGTKFFKMADTNTRTPPGQVNSVLSSFKSFTPEQSDLMAQGIGAYIKDNPMQTMKTFNNMSAPTQTALSQVLGGQYGSSFGAQRLKNLANHASFEDTMNNLTGIVVNPNSHGVGTAGTLLAAEAADKFMENPAGFLSFHAPLIAGAIGAKMAYNASQTAQAKALLKSAVDSYSNPAARQKFSDMLDKDPNAKSLWADLQSKLARYSAANVGYQPTAKQYKRGGKTGPKGMPSKMNHAKEAARLVLAAERAKKKLGQKTKPLLNVSDNVVAHALDVVNKKI